MVHAQTHIRGTGDYGTESNLNRVMGISHSRNSNQRNSNPAWLISTRQINYSLPGSYVWHSQSECNLRHWWCGCWCVVRKEQRSDYARLCPLPLDHKYPNTVPHCHVSPDIRTQCNYTVMLFTKVRMTGIHFFKHAAENNFRDHWIVLYTRRSISDFAEHAETFFDGPVIIILMIALDVTKYRWIESHIKIF